MASFFAELKRRNVVKVAAAYAIVSWILVEVSSVLGPALNLPDWATSFVAFLLILGFPVAMLLTWAYELTPDGMKKSHTVPLSDSITHVTGRKLDFGIIALLVISLGFVIYNYVLVDEPDVVVDAQEAPAAEEAQPEPEPVGAVPDEEQREVLPNSVAVLPFDNLSLDPEDAFFAAGIHDELLNQLTKIRDLSVIARTSVLRYEDTDLSIPEIATELNVENIMEGTVRYADGNVRVTTQLIDAATGAHLWAETYTRPFENIFEIETDIATQIASALKAEFSPEEQQRIAGQSGSRSSEAFKLYVQAKQLWQSHGPEPEILARVQSGLQRVIELDPEFASPHAILADIYGEQTWADTGTPSNWRDRVEELEKLAEGHAQRALELDPNTGYAWSALGKLRQNRWLGREALEAHQRAMELSPNDAEVMIEAAYFHSYAKRHEEAIRYGQRAVELDINNSDIRMRYANVLEMAEQREAALIEVRKAVESNPANPNPYLLLASAEAQHGNHANAVEALRNAERQMGNTRAGFFIALLTYHYGLAKSPDDAARLFESLEDHSENYRVGDLSWASAYLGIGNQERALEALKRLAEEKGPDDGTGLIGFFVNNIWGDPVLEQPEFVEVRERLQLPDL